MAPELIGQPLASPARRLVAMLVDLILVGMLATAGGGVLLGLAAVFVLLTASRKDQRGGFIRRSTRLALRVTAALLMFWLILKLWNVGEQKIDDISDDHGVEAASGNLNLDFSWRDAPALAGAMAGLRDAPTPNEITEHARVILETTRDAGATPLQIRSARKDMVEMLGHEPDSARIAAIDSAIRLVAGPPLSERDSFNAVIAQLQRNRDTLAAALERAKEQRGVRTFITGFFDDLGLGFGWAAIFFTAFLALMRGQTPGKKMLGIRVIRLDGKPLGWWISFERFGGYAASLTLGLLGFLQILWDRNRQGLHDKACETVVVRNTPQTAARS